MKKMARLLIATSTVIAISSAIFIFGPLTVPLAAEDNQKPTVEERLSNLEKLIQVFSTQGGIDKEQRDRQNRLNDLK